MNKFDDVIYRLETELIIAEQNTNNIRTAITVLKSLTSEVPAESVVNIPAAAAEVATSFPAVIPDPPPTPWPLNASTPKETPDDLL